MIKIKNILYTTDFSEGALQVLPQAVYLAGKYGARLHMLHAIILYADDAHHPEYHFPDIDNLVKLLQKNARAKMDDELKDKDIKNIEVKKVQKRGFSAAPVILDYCRENDIDLIVMGTHGRRGIGRLFLGSVTEEVVRLSACPVMTIRTGEDHIPTAAKKKILVPIDFSIHSKTALAYALQIAPTYNACLQLLHIIEESVHPSFYAAGISSIFEIDPQLINRSKQAVKEMVEELDGSRLETDNFIVEGRAAPEIVKFSENKASDMIIIATHGLTGIEHFLIGSVTEKVVRLAKCPVLTVKVFGKSLL